MQAAGLTYDDMPKRAVVKQPFRIGGRQYDVGKEILTRLIPFNNLCAMFSIGMLEAAPKRNVKNGN